MKRTITLAAAGVALAAGVVSAFGASAALRAGNYNLAGIDMICLVADGTWYMETGPSDWHGKWMVGPNSEDSTLIYGNYSGGVGNDFLVVNGGGYMDWIEWADDLSFHNFVDAQVTRIGAKCSPQSTAAATRKNPME